MSGQLKNRTFGSKLRTYFFSGLSVIVPLFLTFYFIFLIFDVSHRFVGRHINIFFSDNYGFEIPGVGLLLSLLFVLIVGVLVRNFVVKKIFAFAERSFYRIPVVAGIYPPAKKLSDFLFEEDKRGRFKKVVLVEYPAEGSYSLGFLTGEGIEQFNGPVKKELVTVLVPLSPMPHSGMLLILPREKITDIEMSVNDAIKLILSGGVVSPQKDTEK